MAAGRFGRLARRAFKTLLWLSFTLVALLALAVGLLHTNWGRNLIREQAVARVGEMLDGSIEIARVRGSFLGRIELEGVVVRDRAGDVVIEARTLAVDYAPGSLLGKHLEVESIEIDGARVQVEVGADGTVNLAQLLKSSPDEPEADDGDGSGSAWMVTVARVTLTNSTVHVVPATGPPATFAAIDVAVREVVLAGDTVGATLEHATATLEQAALPISIAGAAYGTGDTYRATLDARVGSTTLLVPGLLAFADGSLDAASIEVHVAQDDVEALARAYPAVVPAGALLVDVDVDASARRVDAHHPLQLFATATAADGELGVRARLDVAGRSASGLVYGRDVTPSELVRDGPDARLALNLAFEGHGPTWKRVSGSLGGSVDGHLDVIEDARLDLDLVARDGRVTGAVSSRAQGAVARSTVVARLDVDPIHIDQLDIDGNVAPLLALVPRDQQLRARGPIQLAVHASGPVDALTANGSVAIGGIRFGTTSASSGAIEFDVTGIPAKPVGVAEGTLRGVRAGRTSIGPVRATAVVRNLGDDVALTARAGTARTDVELRLSADVHRQDRHTDIALSTLRARLRALTVQGSGGRIGLDPTGDVTVRGVRLSSDAGRIGAEGSLDRGLRVTLADIDLAALARAAALAPGPSGRVDLAATIRRRGTTFGARIEGSATAVTMKPRTAAIDATFSATVEPRKLEVIADLDGGALGTAHLDVDGRAPRDPTDAAAWSALVPRLVRSGHLTVENASIARALAAARQPASGSGRVDLDLTLSDEGQRLDGTIVLANARAVGIDATGSGTITVGMGQGQATLAARAAVTDVGTLTADGRARIPARLLDVDAWLALDERAIESIDATTSAISLDRLAARAPNVAQLAGLGGTLVARVGATDRAELVTIDVTARGLTGELPKVPVDLAVHADVRRDDASMTVRGGFQGSPELVATATANAGLRALRAPTAHSFDHVAIRGSADLGGQELRVISAAIDPIAGAFTAGVLDVHAVFGGTVSKPTAHAKVTIDRPTIAGIAFADIKATAQARPNQVSAYVAARQRLGGRLVVRGTADPRSVDALDAHLFATKFDLGFLAQFVPIETGTLVDEGGRLDGSVAVTGTLERPVPVGTLRVTGAELRATGLARALTSLDVTAAFTPGKLDLTASTRSGEGQASVAGHVTLDGLELRRGKMSATTTKFPVLAGEMVLAVDSAVSGTMTATRRRMDIELDVDRALVIVPRKSTSQRELHEIRSFADIVFVDAAAKAEAAAKLQAQLITIKVRAPETIRVRGEEINAVVDVDLQTRLVSAGVSITGTVEITQGYLELFDRRYDMTAATMSFDGKVPADPRLDFRLGHDFGSLTVFIQVTGTLSQPKLAFSSEPAIYDQATLLAIVLGSEPGEADSDETIGSRAVNVASGVILDELRALAQDALPIDVLRIEEGTTASGETARRVVIGVWLTDDLFVAYRYGTASDVNDNANQVEVEYRLGKRWRIEATYGDNNKGGVDILWVKRY